MSDANANISISIDTSTALSQLKALQRQISLFHTSVAKSTTTAARAQQDLQKSLIDDINATGKFAASLTKIKTSTETFTDSLERNKFSMREYFRYAGASTKTFGRMFKSEFDTISKVAEERVKTLQTQYIKLGRDANGALQSISIRPLALDMQDYGTKTALAAQKQALFNQLMKQGSTNLLNFGKNTQWAGRQLMVGFTIPLTLLGSTASKVFMDMEAQALKFKKVYGDLFTPAAETQRALDDIKELGRVFTRYGVAVSETMGLAAEAAAAGFQGTDLMRQTTEATRLSVLGEIDRQQALKTTIALQNAFGLSSDELASKINFLNAVENQTVTSLNDITEAIPRVAPVIQQLGGNVEDLAYFITAMKEGGINAAEGANALKSGLSAIINPTGKAAAMFEKLNININDIVLKNKGNLKATIQSFASALDDLDPLNRAQALEQLFGRFQLARVSALFANIAKDGSQASKVLGIASTSFEDLAATADSELGLIEQSASTKFKAAVENLKLSIAPVGEEFLKAVTPIVEFFGNIADKFNNLSDRSKRIITLIVGLVGAIGPVFLMTFGLLANGVANIIKLFLTLRMGFQRITGQSNILSEQTQYLTQAQAEAAAVAHSLDQTHAKLIQTFNVEASALTSLATVYERANKAGLNFAARNPGSMTTPVKGFADGIVSVPGPKGAGDIIPAMLSPGESVIPAKQTAKYGGLIQGIIADKIPGFATGLSPIEQFIKEITAPSVVRSTGQVIPMVGGKSSSSSSKPTNIKLLEMYTEILESKGQEAVDTFTRFIKDTIAAVDQTNLGNKKALVQLELINKQAMKILNKPQFSHLGSGTKMTASELLQPGVVSDQTTRERLKKFSQIPGTENTRLRVKTGYGIDLFSGINNAMGGAGAELEELITDFRERGIEKWRKTIIMGGGSFDDLQNQITIYNQAMLETLQRNAAAGKTKIFDTQADLEEALIKGQIASRETATTMDEIERQTRQNAQALGSELNKVFQQALSTIIDIRFDNADSKALIIANDRQLATDLGLLRKGGQPRFTPGGSNYYHDKPRGAGTIPENLVESRNSTNAVIEAVRQEAGTQSPSRKTIPIGEDIARGLQVGMQSQFDETARVGQQLGQRATSLINPKTGLPFTVAERGITPQPPVAAPLVIRESTLLKESMNDASDSTKDFTKTQTKSSESLKSYNSMISKTSFGLSALSSAGMMLGGNLGNLSQKIFMLSTAMFALQQITQLVTKEQALALVSRRAGLAAGAISAAKTGGGLLSAKGGIGGFFAMLGRAGLAIKTFLGPIGLITTAVGLGAFAFNSYRKKQEEVIKELDKFKNALTTSKNEIDVYGQIFGVVPNLLPSERNNATTLRQDKRSAVDKLRDDEKFINESQSTIDSLKRLTKEDAMTALESKGLLLRAKGFSEEQVQTILTAIVEETGRNDLVLNFKNIKFTDKALNNIDSSITRLTKNVTSVAFENELDRVAKEKQKEIDYLKKQYETQTGKFDPGAGVPDIKANKDLFDQEMAAIEERYSKITALAGTSAAAMEGFSLAFSQNAESLAGLLENGVINVEQYQSAWDSLSKSFDKLSPRAQALTASLILDKILKDTNPELLKTTKNLEGIADQALMVQLATFGMTTELLAYTTAANQLKTAQSGVREGGLGVLARAEVNLGNATTMSKKAIKAKAQEMAKLAEEYKKYIDLQDKDGKNTFNLIKYLEAEIKQRDNQVKSLKILAKAKVDAQTAMDIINNPDAAAALATGQNLTKVIEKVNALTAATKMLKLVQDALKPKDEILKDQLEGAKNLLDYEQYVYELQYQKQLDQFELETTINEYALAQIQEQEDAINKTYDKQIKALDEVQSRQEKINQLQRGRLSLAQALSSGDMAGAAAAIQSIREQEAQDQMDRKRKMLEEKRNRDLANVTFGGVIGRTEFEKRNKEEIETAQKKIDLEKQRIQFLTTVEKLTKTQMGMTRNEIDRALEGLDLAKNAKVDVDSKTFLQNLMAGVLGDAKALNSSVDDAANTFDQYVTSVNNVRKNINLSVIELLDLAKKANDIANTVNPGTTPASSAPVTGGGSIVVGGNIIPINTPKTKPTIDTKKQEKARQEFLRSIGIPGFESGGKVRGPGTSKSDSIPAMLSNGEYVVNASSVRKYGVGLFEMLNTKKLADGGAAWQEKIPTTSKKKPPIFQKENWEKTANFFGLPQIGRTLQDIVAHGGPNPISLGIIQAKQMLGMDTKSSYGDNLATGLSVAPMPVRKLATGPGAKALSIIKNSTTSTYTKIDKLVPMEQVPVVTGRSMGPGMYFDDITKRTAESQYYGSNTYKPKLSPLTQLKILQSKGFLDYTDVQNKTGLRLQDIGVTGPFPGVEQRPEAFANVRNLMNQGYLGIKEGSYTTNWLPGSDKGFKLKPVQLLPSNFGYVTRSMKYQTKGFEHGISYTKKAPGEIANLINRIVQSRKINKINKTKNNAVPDDDNIFKIKDGGFINYFANGGGAWEERLSMTKKPWSFSSMPILQKENWQSTIGLGKSLTIDAVKSIGQSLGRVLDPTKNYTEDNRPLKTKLLEATGDAFNVGSLGLGPTVAPVASKGLSQIGKVISNAKQDIAFVKDVRGLQKTAKEAKTKNTSIDSIIKQNTKEDDTLNDVMGALLGETKINRNPLLDVLRTKSGYGFQRLPKNVMSPVEEKFAKAQTAMANAGQNPFINDKLQRVDINQFMSRSLPSLQDATIASMSTKNIVEQVRERVGTVVRSSRDKITDEFGNFTGDANAIQNFQKLISMEASANRLESVSKVLDFFPSVGQNLLSKVLPEPKTVVNAAGKSMPLKSKGGRLLDKNAGRFTLEAEKEALDMELEDLWATLDLDADSLSVAETKSIKNRIATLESRSQLIREKVNKDIFLPQYEKFLGTLPEFKKIEDFKPDLSLPTEGADLNLHSKGAKWMKLKNKQNTPSFWLKALFGPNVRDSNLETISNELFGSKFAGLFKGIEAPKNIVVADKNEMLLYLASQRTGLKDALVDTRETMLPYPPKKQVLNTPLADYFARNPFAHPMTGKKTSMPESLDRTSSLVKTSILADILQHSDAHLGNIGFNDATNKFGLFDFESILEILPSKKGITSDVLKRLKEAQSFGKNIIGSKTFQNKDLQGATYDSIKEMFAQLRGLTRDDLAKMLDESNMYVVEDKIKKIFSNTDMLAAQIQKSLPGIGKLKNGGLINYFANGGYARGTDRIPAMLSAGEYVIQKKAVDTIGLDNMDRINKGQLPSNSNSVYNYGISVNVNNSNANPNDIARTVINQIKQIDAQRIRSYR